MHFLLTVGHVPRSLTHQLLLHWVLGAADGPGSVTSAAGVDLCFRGSEPGRIQTPPSILRRTVWFSGLSRPSRGVHTFTCGPGIGPSLLRPEGRPPPFLPLSHTSAGFLGTARRGLGQSPVLWVLPACAFRCGVSRFTRGHGSLGEGLPAGTRGQAHVPVPALFWFLTTSRSLLTYFPLVEIQDVCLPSASG